jgi:hypothetical protein
VAGKRADDDQADDDARTPQGKRLALARALALGGSIKAAAAASGVPATTAQRWLKRDAGFQRLLDEIRHELVRQMVGREIALNIRADRTLRGLLESKNEDIKMRAVNAARATVPAILAHLALVDRLKAVEARLDEYERAAGSGVAGANGFPR